MPLATFMPLASELPSGALVKAWTTQHPGQVIDTEQEACGFHLCLLTYTNLNLCNGNKSALLLSNWLPCIIFVLGSRMQFSLKREKSNKSDSCLFPGSGDSESLPVAEILYLWHNPVTWYEEFPMTPHDGRRWELWGPLSSSPVISASPGNRTAAHSDAPSRNCCLDFIPHLFPHLRGRGASLSSASTWVWPSPVCHSLLCRVSFLALLCTRGLPLGILA